MTPSGNAYVCPMHRSVRVAGPGKCPKCGMALVPEQARFRLLRHMFGNPLHAVVMLALMAALMAAAMMFMR
jgi:Cu+-exporting ATPase